MTKLSGTQPQHEFPIFFLDRNLGKEKLAGSLLNEGFHCKLHDNYYPQDEDDEVWLAGCGRRRWIVITPDARILREPQSMRAIGSSKARVFFLPDNNTHSELWAECLKTAYPKIMAALQRHRGPFVAKISKLGRVWNIRELTRAGKDKRKKKNRRCAR